MQVPTSSTSNRTLNLDKNKQKTSIQLQLLSQVRGSTWKDAYIVNMIFPFWIACTCRVANIWPSRVLSTLYMMGAAMEPVCNPIRVWRKWCISPTILLCKTINENLDMHMKWTHRWVSRSGWSTNAGYEPQALDSPSCMQLPMPATISKQDFTLPPPFTSTSITPSTDPWF